MERFLIFIFVLVFYFFGNVSSKLGFTGAQGLYTLFIIFVFVYLVYGIKQERISASTNGWLAIGGGGIYLAIRHLQDTSYGMVQAILISILPAMLIMLFTLDLPDEFVQQKIKKHIKTFFIIECLMAIVEFALHHHIIGWVDITYGEIIHYTNQSNTFRSVALLGSPLGNANIVFTMMQFFLFDTELSDKTKYRFYLLGILALFCFNARTAIVLSGLSVMLFSVHMIFKGTIEQKRSAKHLVVLTIVIFVLALSLGMGSRLTGTTSFDNDSSIAVRTRMFEYMFAQDWSQYLLGMSNAAYLNEMEAMGVLIIENFWVINILRFGLIFTVFWALCYFLISKKLLAWMPPYNKLVIGLLFITLSSISNSMSSSYRPMFTFLLCCWAFQPTNCITETTEKEL